MYGVIAQQTAGTVIAVTGASIDFINEVYTIDGVGYAASDIIDKPGRVGASGLEILDDDADGVVEAIGDLQAAILTAHWTIVIEYEVLDPSAGFSTVLSMKDDESSQTFEVYSSDSDLEAYDNNGDDIREVAVTISSSAGIRRVAITRTTSELSIAGDGGAADTVTLPSVFIATSASFGGFVGGDSFEGCFIRTLDIMAPVDAAELPGLSA